MSHDKLLQERHRVMTSPEALIADAVEAACGSPMATKSRIVEGFSNEVYVATTVDGLQVIVRIHWSAPYFEPEQWALVKCTRLALPAPRLLRLQYINVGGTPRSVCVETRLPGRTLRAALDDVGIPTSDLRAILVAAGTFLAVLHTVPTTGFGRIDANGTAAEPSWDGYRHRLVLDQTYQAARNLGIPISEVDEAIALLDAASDLWKSVTPRLLHGDFTPQNILVEDGHFQGVIDFEFPMSGDPAWELAMWDYYRQSLFHNPTANPLPLEWLLEGYQQISKADEHFAARIIGSRLQLGLDLLNYHGVRDDQDPRFLGLIRASFLRDLAEMRRWRESH